MIEDTHEIFCAGTPVQESRQHKAKKWQKHRYDSLPGQFYSTLF
jgi:hypothetical protein